MGVKFKAFALGVIVALGGGPNVNATSPLSPQSCIDNLCAENFLPRETLNHWLSLKNEMGPTFAGTPSWQRYMSLIEDEAKKRGMVDFTKNHFIYDNWQTSMWPDKSKWSFTIGDQRIPVGHYAASAGSTGPDGVTGEMVFVNDWEKAQQTDLRDKILIVPVKATNLLKNVPDWLYEGHQAAYPVGHEVLPKETVYQDTVSQLFAANLRGVLGLPKPHLLKKVTDAKPKAVVFAFDMINERVEGLLSYPIPPIYDIPVLYMGREALTNVQKILSKKPKQNATVTLDATIEKTSAYQLTGYLPGKNYGSQNDEIIMMISHTDGPSISQENGPLGLLSMVHYFAQIPQQQRDKTLMFFLDSRHYIPGREATLPDYNIENVFAEYGALAPLHGRIVASVHLEHLGQIEYRERNGKYEPTGKAESGSFYVTGYQPIIDIARQALDAYKPENHSLRTTDLPGIHCQNQGIWFGLGHWPRRIGVEAIASTMSFMGAYWGFDTDLSDVDVDLFERQVNTMTQITAQFMSKDITNLLSVKATQPACKAGQ